MRSQFETCTAIGRNCQPLVALSASKRKAVDVQVVGHSTHWQAVLIGVVDAKLEQEFLLQQACVDQFDVGQLYLGLMEIPAKPGTAAG